MTNQHNGCADLDALFSAADQHAEDTGEPDMTVGDLQALLRDAWRLMNRAQRSALLNTETARDLLALDERHDAGSRCSDCGGSAASLLHCPDGAEVCTHCEGRH